MTRLIPIVVVSVAAALLAVAAAARPGASPPNELIAFERQAGTAGAATIYVVRPDGTDLRRVTRDETSSDPAWSPDRRRLAFVSGRSGAFWAPDLYVMDGTGRNVRRLTRGPATRTKYIASSEPSWAPDGRRIVFVRTDVTRSRGRSDLWIVGADGRGLRRLTATPENEASPSFSPHGVLAYARGGTEIEIVIKLLNEPRSGRVTRGESPAWSPTGDVIAFARAGAVYTVREDGTDERRVATGGAPSWASDGSRIVVTTPAGLVSVARDGSDPRAVTRRPESAYDFDASWSSARALPPRGLTSTTSATAGPVVYATGRGTNAELYVRDPVGVVRRVTRNRVYDGFPTWAPDRRHIAFVRGSPDSDVYVMRADGSNARRVTRGGGPDLYPAWSPDGKQIAFSSGRAGAEPEIYVVRPNGGALRRLTRTANWVQDVQPQFSPDGRHIVFTSNRVAYWNFEIFRVRASDGRGLKRLTFWGSGADGAAGDDHMPSYSPDGKSIVFVSDRFGGDAIWTMDSDGTNARGVLHHRGVAPTFPRFSPDGSHIVWSSLSDNPATDEQIHTVRADGNFADTLARGREADW